MGISESNDCAESPISPNENSTMFPIPLAENDVSPISPLEENIDHSHNSGAAEITKEFFENYPILEISWDDPSLYVEEENENEIEMVNENTFTAAVKPYQTNDRWSFLKSEPSKKLKKVTKKKNTSTKSRISSQSSEERYISECSDSFTVPDYNTEENHRIPTIYQKLEENYQRQNYIHQKILQLQEEAYQLEFEAHFLQSTIYHQQCM